MEISNRFLSDEWISDLKQKITKNIKPSDFQNVSFTAVIKIHFDTFNQGAFFENESFRALFVNVECGRLVDLKNCDVVLPQTEFYIESDYSTLVQVLTGQNELKDAYKSGKIVFKGNWFKSIKIAGMAGKIFDNIKQMFY